MTPETRYAKSGDVSIAYHGKLVSRLSKRIRREKEDSYAGNVVRNYAQPTGQGDQFVFWSLCRFEVFRLLKNKNRK